MYLEKDAHSFSKTANSCNYRIPNFSHEYKNTLDDILRLMISKRKNVNGVKCK